MNPIRSILQAAWRCLPQSARRLTATAPGVASLRDAAARWGLNHDDKYCAAYYEEIDGCAGHSLQVVADSIISEFRPKRVIDVGCGTGSLLQQLQQRGVDGLGLELSAAGLAKCRERGLDVREFNLLNDTFDRPERFDVAVSMEVAEHLPEEGASRYVGLLCELAPAIVFTAAPPGQLGVDHVNLQTREYWEEHFAQRGFAADDDLTARWAKAWEVAGTAKYYCSNLIVFRHRNGAGQVQA